MPARSWWLSLTVPALAFVVAVAGQFKEQFSVLALACMAPLLLWALGLAIAVVVQTVRHAPLRPMLAGIGVSAVAVAAALPLVMGVPLWAQWTAAPAITALEAIRTETGKYPDVGSFDGDFPRELRPTLEVSGHCLYKPHPPAYALQCVGRLPFAHYRYDGGTRAWSAWD